MRRLSQHTHSSTRPLNLRTMTTLALLMALGVICGYLKIPVTSFLEIRFSYLPIAAAGILTGPVGGLIVGIGSDILGYLVKPTGAYFPGFTLSGALTGLLYGLVLHRHRTLPSILAAQALVTGLVNLPLNTLWLSLLYGTPFTAILAPRLIKEAVFYPIEVACIWLMVRPLLAAERQILSPASPAGHAAEH